MPQTTRLILGFLVLFGFFARAASYKSPLFDHQAWRQADTASIARNFYRERFNILYPQIDQRGNQADGYVETGLELFAFTVAAIAKVAGFHHEIGRLLSALLFVASALLVRAFVRRRFGARTAMIAVFLYAFAFPLQLFIERAFMNEALLVCLSLACLVAAQRYLAFARVLNLIALLAASALLGAVKLPYLIVWAPVAGLFLESRGTRGLLSWELALMMAVDLAAAGAWYSHAHRLALETGLSFGLFDKLFDARLVFSPDFAAVIAARLTRDVLGPVGILGTAVGLFAAVKQRRWCEPLGVAAFAAYVLLVARGNYIHDYYQLAIMPVAPSLAASGLGSIAARVASDRRRQRTVLAGLLALAATSTFVRLASAHSWFEYADNQMDVCRRLASTVDPNERVVIAGNNDPLFLYCIDRKGWLLSPAESDRAHILDAYRNGAGVAIFLAPATDDDLRRFLAESATAVLETDGVSVVRFRRDAQ
jgi:hypothetical protein